jgi:site-specific recombinase XerD
MAKREIKKARGVFEKTPESGVWWIQWFDTEGKRHRQKVGRRSDAIDAYAVRKADASRGAKIAKPLRQRDRTFQELADNAVAYAKAHKANPADDEQKIGVLATEFGSRSAESLTQAELTAFLETRKMGPGSFNRYKAALSITFREAIRQGWTERNPARLMKAKKEPNGRIRFLSEAEETRLRKVIDVEYAHFLSEFEIALHTGMRRSEQFSMSWAQVDFEARRIHLPKTKNGSPRSIPLNSVALVAFERQHEATGHQPWVFITQDRQQPFAPRAPRLWFEEALAKAKVHDFTWHCLRHTFISRLVQAGAHLKVAQELAGHKTLAMTGRYAHLAPAHLRDAVELIAGGTPKTATRRQKGRTATTTATSAKKATRRRPA